MSLLSMVYYFSVNQNLIQIDLIYHALLVYSSDVPANLLSLTEVP